MDALSTATTVVKSATLVEKAVGWFRRWRGGAVTISTPANRDVLSMQPWISMTCVHTNAKGTYWLLTHTGDKYWPQNKLALEHDGRWTSKVHVNTKSVTRTYAIVVARVGDFANAVFEDYKARGGKMKNWDPLKLPSGSAEFTIVSEIAITILGSDSGSVTN